MANPSYQRKLTENEVIFRNANQEVQNGLKRLQTMAADDGNGDIYASDKTQLNFYCECSNEKCQKRILLLCSTYERLHLNSKHFVIIPGHQVVAVEKVVATTPNYLVVEKNMQPPKHTTTLHKSGL